MSAELIDRLTEIVGSGNLLLDNESKAKYGTDWTRFYSPSPLAVVMARDAAQLSRLVEFAREHKLALVPSGGRTGLSGGAVAANGELVVSFEKMARILDFNEIDQSVTVEAGVVTRTLQEFAGQHGLCYPVDFASSGSSQIGGNIATNAGGIKVVRYGLTRDQIAGLKVVTGTGECLDLNRGLVKNSTGYDLRHLFIGSEGTLGFVVEATIRLTRGPKDPVVALLAVPKMTDLISVMQSFKQRMTLLAFEFFSHKALRHVLSQHDMQPPFEDATDYYALIEFDGGDGNAADMALQAFDHCVEAGYATTGVISQSGQQREDLWHYREFISESISPYTPYKNDIAVRVSRVPEFLGEVDALVTERYPAFEIVWFGHIGDGNVHLNILKPDDWSTGDFKQECERVSEEVLGLVQKYEGSVSAEHGIGLLKRAQLGYSRSEREIDFMRAIKSTFDPDGIMNPGKLLQ